MQILLISFQNSHYHHTNLEILMFDRRFKMKLELNRYGHLSRPLLNI